MGPFKKYDTPKNRNFIPLPPNRVTNCLFVSTKWQFFRLPLLSGGVTCFLNRPYPSKSEC